jgi:propanediol utilization protein
VESMGVYAPLIYSGNIFLGPGLGTVDEEGTLIKEKTILAVRSLVKSIELVCKHAGVAM